MTETLCYHGRPIACLECAQEYRMELEKPFPAKRTNLPREAVITALEEIAARWGRDVLTYPVDCDQRALGAAAAVRACARELRAAAELLQETL